jgi:esterase/lipase
MKVDFNHMEVSCIFLPTKAETKKQELIILAHGLMRTWRSMKRLGYYLNDHGYDVCIYQYPSTKFDINKHSEHMQDFLHHLLLNEDVDRQFCFVTHSLGGILVRDAICQLSLEEQTRFKKLVMLAPPNKGSAYASRVLKIMPFLSQFIKPLAALRHMPEAPIHKIPTPKALEIGVIAGKYDAKSTPASTHLKEQCDFMLVHATHSFLMNSNEVRKAILNFLQVGHFK